MFNKREEQESGPARAGENRPASTRDVRPAPPRSPSGPAMIGASITVDGQLRGEEDLIIEGKVKGSVEFKKNSVTIGAQGDVRADIYAHTIYVDGAMDGNLVASERVVIRQSARIKGSVASPRVSLEDGARFNGSIDMDAESETLAKAFPGNRKSAPATASGTGAASGGSQGKSAGDDTRTSKSAPDSGKSGQKALG